MPSASTLPPRTPLPPAHTCPLALGLELYSSVMAGQNAGLRAAPLPSRVS